MSASGQERIFPESGACPNLAGTISWDGVLWTGSSPNGYLASRSVESEWAPFRKGITTHGPALRKYLEANDLRPHESQWSPGPR